ncbi:MULTISPECIES: LysR family transcriptional regulator [Mycetohabitans]|uniref:Regulatory helix-turn-helix LysR family protein n=1 Tax=Mycetohabitans endofungorum TaxID=417203 RepID=A0A2P5KAM8_9BURK|nr:regulatory helix-turn-helix LysR family protein [Mycetohabitans endofungorum]
MQELLAFDAAARHEGLTRAASSLCITVSGVSEQISTLKAFIGRLKKLLAAAMLDMEALKVIIEAKP